MDDGCPFTFIGDFNPINMEDCYGTARIGEHDKLVRGNTESSLRTTGSYFELQDASKVRSIREFRRHDNRHQRTEPRHRRKQSWHLYLKRSAGTQGRYGHQRPAKRYLHHRVSESTGLIKTDIMKKHIKNQDSSNGTLCREYPLQLFKSLRQWRRK